MKKKAFTLAEVLITIGIIGIVAAMTLPIVVMKYQRAQLRAQLNKSYSIMQSALQKMQVDMGVVPNAQNFSRQKFKESYIKYFNVLIDCGLGSTDVTDRENAQTYCVNEQTHHDEGNRRYTEHYQTFNKKRQIDNTLLNNGQFVLTDGTIIMIENWDTGRLYISADINGIKNSPNIWGQDLFTFQLMDNGKLMPMGMPGTHYPPETYCSKTSTHTYNGVGCTYWALTDDSFWNVLSR